MGLSRIHDAEAAPRSALGKALRVLEAISRASSPPSLAELELQLGMPKTSIHRLIAQLEDEGLVLRDVTERRYALGARLQRLSVDALSSPSTTFPTRQVLTDLVARIGESCNLGVRDGAEVAYVDRVECNWPLRTHFTAGSRVPIHCTAIGKLFLANMPPEQLRSVLGNAELVPFTGNTRTTLQALAPDLDRIRAEDVAYNDQEFMVGLIGVGVPIRRRGRMVAGVALHAPVPRLTIDDARVHVDALQQAAARIETMLEDRE